MLFRMPLSFSRPIYLHILLLYLSLPLLLTRRGGQQEDVDGDHITGSMGNNLLTRVWYNCMHERHEVGDPSSSLSPFHPGFRASAAKSG